MNTYNNFDELAAASSTGINMIGFNAHYTTVDNMSPVFTLKDGYKADKHKFFIESIEGPRPHVHVKKEGKEAKFWLDTLEVKSRGGMKDHELSAAKKHIKENQKEFIAQYKEYWEKIDPSRKAGSDE